MWSKATKKYSTLDIEYFVGKSVKDSFNEINTNNTEHLWVDINFIVDSETLKGTIANDVILNVGLQYGDTVEIKIKNIEQIFNYNTNEFE